MKKTNFIEPIPQFVQVREISQAIACSRKIHRSFTQVHEKLFSAYALTTSQCADIAISADFYL